jgi:hypothetical protein
VDFKNRFEFALKLSDISSANQFCGKFNISKASLSKVMNNKVQLPVGLAYKIQKAFESMNVACEIDYFLGESETPPYIAFNKTDQNISLTGFSEIDEECELFKTRNNSIVTTISDDTLEPFLMSGDLIGGFKTFIDFDKSIESLCIINYTHILGDDFTTARYLRNGYKENLYTLAAININSSMSEPNIYNTTLNWIAPVCWIRKNID